MRPPLADSVSSPTLDAGVKVKICGITRPDDARVAEAAGADYVGVILVDGSPRKRSLAQARQIADAVALPLVIVVADQPVHRLAEMAEMSGAAAIQLHGEEGGSEIDELRALGEWELWKALRVRTSDQIREALTFFGPRVDRLLLDAWHPNQLGGTGRTFPWGLLEELREDWPAGPSLGVAGGLVPENVGEAVRRLRPHLVDVSSGVESDPGVKAPERVRLFVQNAKKPLIPRTAGE